MTNAGIQDIAFATGHYSFDLQHLADKMGIDVNKFYIGIGQETMSVVAADEDIVTMAAAAASRVLERNSVDGIRTLIFATESSIDQSKSAGVYVHSLIGLPEHVRTVEMKQACYSGAGALQMALGIVARNPQEKVLVVASDVARYDLDTSGEPTQGAAAVAFLVQADPALLTIEPASGLHTNDVQDFWRPNYRNTALVDGKFSITAYIRALEGSWKDYQEHGGAAFDDIAYICYHQPFTKMAVKAHIALSAVAGREIDKATAAEELAPTFALNKQLGNSYTAAMFLGLIALLEADEDLTGQRIGFFSYGSGAVAEFFTGIVQPGYQKLTRKAEHAEILAQRTALSYDDYRALHPGTDVVKCESIENPKQTDGEFRFAGIRENSRIYEKRS